MAKSLERLLESAPLFLEGLKNTVTLSLLGVLLGIVLGTVITLFRLSNNKGLRGFAKAYVELIRCTPLMIQVFIVYFGFTAGFHLKISPYNAGLIALTINSAAYVSEIMRSGIESIDKGQFEASRSLGMNYAKTMRYIILPQAIKNILPALCNEFVAVIKETSTLTVIGVHETMFNTNRVKASTYMPIAPLIVAFFIYFVLTFTLSRAIAALERRMKVSD